MLTPPPGLPGTAVTAALARGWGLAAVSVAYRAVGFGSHHWAVTDSAGGRWFVSGDDLVARRQYAAEPLTAVFGRLRGSLAAARDLRDQGLTFVVAPVPGADGEILLRAGDQFSLALYPHVARRGRDRPDRMVLTHGEPHPGNTMLAPTGWRLIDWDTVLVAPPERDLCRLDPGDGSVLAGYTAATGVAAAPEMLELYRSRWDLADVALTVSRFRAPHPGSADDDQDWEILRGLVSRRGAQRAAG